MCQGYTVCPLAKVPIFLNFGTSEVERQGSEYNCLMILALSITQGIRPYAVRDRGTPSGDPTESWRAGRLL